MSVGHQQTRQVETQTGIMALFLLWARTVFPYTCPPAHTLSYTHTGTHTSTAKHQQSKAYSKYILPDNRRLPHFESHCQAFNSPEVSNIPAKNKDRLLKETGREVQLKEGGVPNIPGITRSEIMPSGRKHCEEWQCQSETSFSSLDLSICQR